MITYAVNYQFPTSKDNHGLSSTHIPDRYGSNSLTYVLLHVKNLILLGGVGI